MIFDIRQNCNNILNLQKDVQHCKNKLALAEDIVQQRRDIRDELEKS